MARILVIDDDQFVRRTIKFLLHALGHDAAEAENGRKGVDMYRAQRYDVVITDMVMPVQDGLETIRLLLSEFRQVPIIAMSGGATALGKARLADASDAGAMAALTKPFTIEELLMALVKCQEHGVGSQMAPFRAVACASR